MNSTIRAAWPLALAVLVLLAVAGTPPAGADGDPASDILQISSLYTPVAQRVSPPVLRRLRAAIAEANASGFAVRVALVRDRTDLGAVPQLFGHPDAYVQLLSGELVYAWKGALVAVQPSGVGVRNVRPLPPAEQLVSQIRVAAPKSSDSLARAATRAVVELAAAAGRPIDVPPATAATGSRSWWTPLAISLASALATVTAVALALRARSRRRSV